MVGPNANVVKVHLCQNFKTALAFGTILNEGAVDCVQLFVLMVSLSLRWALLVLMWALLGHMGTCEMDSKGIQEIRWAHRASRSIQGMQRTFKEGPRGAQHELKG